VKHLPNLLTAARLALAPYLFLLMFQHRYRTMIPLFIVIGITDVVDGFLAPTKSSSAARSWCSRSPAPWNGGSLPSFSAAT
jgi:phosphatidylserine synthase